VKTVLLQNTAGVNEAEEDESNRQRQIPRSHQPPRSSIELSIAKAHFQFLLAFIPGN
jgi:hypothetical protein